MKWEVTLPDDSKVICKADRAKIIVDGVLVFENYLEEPRDSRSVWTTVEAYPLGTWAHMKVIDEIRAKD